MPEKHMAFINQCSKLLEVAWHLCVLSTIVAQSDEVILYGGAHFIDILEGVADWFRKRLWKLFAALAGRSFPFYQRPAQK